MNFLLVDDDPVFLEVTEAVVQSIMPATFTKAASGHSGLDALRNSSLSFDYLVLDLNMPDLDGLGFLRGAAQLGFRGQVIISSGENEAVLNSARALGKLLGLSVLGAMRKPISIDAVQMLLAQKPVASQQRNSQQTQREYGLEELELLPYYQTQHATYDERPVGLEALIRVRTPTGQIRGPSRLFDAPLTHNVLFELSLDIAKLVLADMASWNQAGILLRTAINVDAKVAEDPAFAPLFIELVAKAGIAPEMVCLELTETKLPSDMSHLIESLTRLRMKGFELSLDDYGTGMSSFEILDLCPFTELKIDGSITRSAVDSSIARRFFRDTIAMAKELKLNVVAEGAESEVQARLAGSSGADAIQGYHYSIPSPGSAIREQFLEPAPDRQWA